ncbi:hypothetical protein [Leptolyngbya sp. 'hensonii']|uniref:hypothetical protein n=1 Tax=Leptolyngbya sp. 'hensonii' TaxID=1922337 RepID=UPI0015C54C34|nr:hypothetical protein [Leptolyngbya sp. 'hensonii']
MNSLTSAFCILPPVFYSWGRQTKRGGSWNNNPRNCRSAYRNNNDAEWRNNNNGFRVCCSVSALFCTRAGGWEFTGRVEEEPRPVPVMHQHPKIKRVGQPGSSGERLPHP